MLREAPPNPPTYRWEVNSDGYDKFYRLIHNKEGIVGSIEKSNGYSWYLYDWRLNQGKEPVGGPFSNDASGLEIAFSELLRKMNIREHVRFSRKASRNTDQQMMRLASLQHRVEMLKEASFRLDRQGPSIPPRFANKVKALTGCNVSEISVRDYDGESVGRRMTSFGGYSLFTEEGSFVENTDPPTGDCRDYVILRMPSHFKSASYQFKHRKWGLKGAEPLDFSNPKTLKDVQLTRRFDFLKNKDMASRRGAYLEPLSRSEKEEMLKIKREITKRRRKA